MPIRDFESALVEIGKRSLDLSTLSRAYGRGKSDPEYHALPSRDFVPALIETEQ